MAPRLRSLKHPPNSESTKPYSIDAWSNKTSLSNIPPKPPTPQPGISGTSQQGSEKERKARETEGDNSSLSHMVVYKNKSDNAESLDYVVLMCH